MTSRPFALCVGAAVLLATSAAAEQAPNLLATAQLRRADNVQNPSRITDGVAPVEGDGWNSDFTSIIGPKGIVEWDLGQPTAIEALMLQGDNNDSYVVSGSADGVTWAPLWRAGSTDGAGMRQRSTDAVKQTVRYVQLTAEGGDNLYSVGELVLLAHAADLNHYDVKRVDKPREAPPPVNTSWVVVGVVAFAVVLFLRRRANETAAAAQATPATEAAASTPDQPKP